MFLLLLLALIILLLALFTFIINIFSCHHLDFIIIIVTSYMILHLPWGIWNF